MDGKLKEVGELKKGEFVKWEHLTWQKVSSIKIKLEWAHLRFEGIQREFTIRADIELPWRNH